MCVLCFVYDEMVKLPILPCAEKLELVLSTEPYNGFYVSNSIALCWATFSASYALLSSHVMTNKDDDCYQYLLWNQFHSPNNKNTGQLLVGPNVLWRWLTQPKFWMGHGPLGPRCSVPMVQGLLMNWKQSPRFEATTSISFSSDVTESRRSLALFSSLFSSILSAASNITRSGWTAHALESPIGYCTPHISPPMTFSLFSLKHTHTK